MATNKAHTQAPGGHGPGPFPPFQKETFASQLVWLALTFIALYWIMAKVALPRIGAIIEDRRARIAADLAEAQRLKEQSEAEYAAYEKSLADARGRAQAIAAQTRDELTAQSEANRRRLEDELGAKLAQAEQTIARTKQDAMANVRGIAIEAAAAIVERLTGTPPAEPVVAAAVQDALKS